MIAKKMNADFGYTKEHLDGNEQFIWELGEKYIHSSKKIQYATN
jgi:hypothetical protein